MTISWLAHVRKTMKDHPGQTFNQMLKRANKTYKKNNKRGGKKNKKSKHKKNKHKKTKRRKKI
tara:strand:- start:441 stop:629 length:189 start_codon:yes stop_codon:yes gene_type:complete